MVLKLQEISACIKCLQRTCHYSLPLLNCNDSHESLLQHVELAHAIHTLLLPVSAAISSFAIYLLHSTYQHVLVHGNDAGVSNNLDTNTCLYQYLEYLARNEVLE